MNNFKHKIILTILIFLTGCSSTTIVPPQSREGITLEDIEMFNELDSRSLGIARLRELASMRVAETFKNIDTTKKSFKEKEEDGIPTNRFHEVLFDYQSERE